MGISLLQEHTNVGNTFSYDTSLDKTKTNYIAGLFGSKTQDKETELWMEELYYNVMEDLDTAGKVRGLDITFNEIDSAGST